MELEADAVGAAYEAASKVSAADAVKEGINVGVQEKAAGVHDDDEGAFVQVEEGASVHVDEGASDETEEAGTELDGDGVGLARLYEAIKAT